MAAQGVPEASPAAKVQPSDYRNGDLVSRLLAATPPYLYNMPLLPNSFFFSEMLRSFVQAKAASSAASTGPTHQTPRRGRKRTWKDTTNPKLHHPMMNIQHAENIAREHPNNDKPLELTTTGSRTTPPPPPPPKTPPPVVLIPPTPQQNTAEQFTAPLWYPQSMYHQPPYATTAPFDPLHFFIDLRVSGHIWDQTKNNRDSQNHSRSVEPLDLQTDQKLGLNLKTSASSSMTTPASTEEQVSLFKPSRKHVSAFAVPRPRDVFASPHKCGATGVSEGGDTDQHKNVVSTNYVLQNLSKIYKQVDSRLKKEQLENGNKRLKENDEEEVEEEVVEVKEDVDVRQSADEEEGKTETEKKKCRDLRALIGLELVKDYVSFDGKRYPKGCVPQANSGNGSTCGVDPESALKKETTEDDSDDEDDDDDGSNIQVDDDDDIAPNDSSNDYDVTRRLMNDSRNGQFIDYSQARLQN